MAAADVRLDQIVDIATEGGRIIIEPVVAPTYDLDQLLDALDPDTFPDEIEFGAAVGQEVW